MAMTVMGVSDLVAVVVDDAFANACPVLWGAPGDVASTRPQVEFRRSVPLVTQCI